MGHEWPPSSGHPQMMMPIDAASLSCDECGVEFRVIAHELKLAIKRGESMPLARKKTFRKVCPHRCLACWSVDSNRQS